MSFKVYNVSVPKKYTKDGEEKTRWSNVGQLVAFKDEETKAVSYKLELAMFPDTKFGVFEQKPKEEPKPVVKEQAEDIAPDDIPF